MSGDYSRHTFNPRKHYAGVLMQQGRVQLDADWNEQVEIQNRRAGAENFDRIGPCGVSSQTPDAFRIEVAGGSLTIGPGRMSVHGLLAENYGGDPQVFDAILAELRGSSPLPYADQPYLFSPPSLPAPSDPGLLLVFLEVWRREVTHLEAPDLVEKAVGVDTTTRLQTVWQVRFLPVPAGEEVSCCTADDQIPDWTERTRVSAGRLSSDTVEVDADEDPCFLGPTGGFRGEENRLYRIEIHDPGPTGTATFKWSANNAVLTTAVAAIDSTLTRLTVDTTRKDSVLQFRVGDWVEIQDDAREFDFSRGEMRKVALVDHGTRVVTLESALPAGAFPTDLDGNTIPSRHTRMRLWDQRGVVLDGVGNEIDDVDDRGGVIAVPSSAATAVRLNAGVVVRFDTDPAGGEFQVGDYWNFAARTADSSVDRLNAAPPRGIHRHHCRLAVLESSGTIWNVREDCRPLFPPLTELIRLEYVGGDGQEMLPDSTSTRWLCGPLQVRIVNGGLPVEGAIVQFDIRRPTPAGIARVANTDESGADTSLLVATDSDGVAACLWRLDRDPANPCQQVTATLMKCGQTVSSQQIVFHANLSLASQVANITECPGLAGDATVQDALDTLCRNMLSDQGIHIKGVISLFNNQKLRNDTGLTINQLAPGIRVDCDEVVDPRSIKRPTCFVAVEDPTIVERVINDNLFGAGFVPIVLAAEVGAEQNRIFWRPTQLALDLLRSLKLTDPVLVRLTLKGNFIWGFAADQTRIHLDGEAFGMPGGFPDPFGDQATAIEFPSGNGRRGGDFEMWFWLQAARIVINPSDLLDFGTIVTVEQSRDVRIDNSGEQEYRARISVDGAAFATQVNRIIVKSNSSQPVQVSFRPPTDGAFEGSLAIEGELPDDPSFKVRLIGRGQTIG